MLHSADFFGQDELDGNLISDSFPPANGRCFLSFSFIIILFVCVVLEEPYWRCYLVAWLDRLIDLPRIRILSAVHPPAPDWQLENGTVVSDPPIARAAPFSRYLFVSLFS